MTDWIEHNGGPQPVADDVWVEISATVDFAVNLDGRLQILRHGVEQSQFAPWDYKLHFRILNQHLIDAARLEGIRLGLEAAAYACDRIIRALDPDTIAKEAQHD